MAYIIFVRFNLLWCARKDVHYAVQCNTVLYNWIGSVRMAYLATTIGQIWIRIPLRIEYGSCSNNNCKKKCCSVSRLDTTLTGIRIQLKGAPAPDENMLQYPDLQHLVRYELPNIWQQLEPRFFLVRLSSRLKSDGFPTQWNSGGSRGLTLV